MADVKKKIKARQGHRTFVEGVMTKSCELFAGEITEDICRKLQVNKRILEGKIALLESINGEIVDLLNAKDNIEKEIIDSSEYNATVNECLVQIYIVLTDNAKVQVSPHQPIFTPSTAPIKAKLPKLSLNKFSGSPVDWQAFWDLLGLHHNGQMYHPATHLYRPIQQQTCMSLNFHTPLVSQFVSQVPFTHQTQLLHHSWIVLKPLEHHQPVCLLVQKITYSYKLLELLCPVEKHLVARRILE
jgi:hypothetical protein